MSIPSTSVDDTMYDDETLYELRRQIVMDLIRTQFGTRARFADHCGLKRPYVTRMLKPPGESGTSARRIGDDVAVTIEQRCDLPPGTLLAPRGKPLSELTAGALGAGESPENRGGREARIVWLIESADGHFPMTPDSTSGIHSTEHALLATRDPKAFLFRVPDTSMAPRFNQGEYVLVEPGVAVEIEDEVLVRTIDGRAALARLLSRKAGAVRLGFWGVQATVSLSEDQVSWIYPVAHYVQARRVKA